MKEAASRPAFGRTKHVLPEEERVDAFANDRFHYSLFGFLQKRRGGVGESKPSGSSKSSGSGQVSKPTVPKSGPSTKGPSSNKPNAPVKAPPKAPDTPKPPVKAPPKAPDLPQLPKPKSDWKPPKGSLPGYTPGKPPYHGSGGHLPAIGGGQAHDRAPSSTACINPKGFQRLRCEKADAVIGTIFAVIGFMLLPFLAYLAIRRCKQRRMRKNRHEEDEVELTCRTMDCHPDSHIDREVLDDELDIGLAISTSEESSALAKGRTEDRSLGISPGRKTSPVNRPRPQSVTRGRRSSPSDRSWASVHRGRKRFRSAHSNRSVTSSLSSGMIRTAILGQALQDPTIIDVPPSLASSRKNSERTCSVERFFDCSPHYNVERPDMEKERWDCDDNSMKGSDSQNAERRSGSSGRRSSSRGRSSQRESDVASPEGRASRRSASRSPYPVYCNQDEDCTCPQVQNHLSLS